MSQTRDAVKWAVIVLAVCSSVVAKAAGPQPMAPAEFITPLADQLPFAYYPTTNELEVAFDRASPLIGLHFSAPLQAREVETLRPGLAYAYYEHEKWAWNSDLPDLVHYTPKKQGVIANVNPRELTDQHGGWTALYVGFLRVPEDGMYVFHARPFAKGRLVIAGHEVLQTVRYASYNWRGGAVALEAGLHPFAFVQMGWGEWRQPELPPETLRISGPGMPYQPLPDRLLFHDPAQTAEPSSLASSASAESSLPESAAKLNEVIVRVTPLWGGSVVIEGRLQLKEDGRAQARLALPDLPEGEYAVEYLFGPATIRATTHFRRIHFPWEGNSLGIERKIYPPFERVKVEGRQVQVSDRTYQINEIGAFDQVTSLGLPLLADPMRIYCQTDKGTEALRMVQTPRGFAPHVDEAVFMAEAAVDAVRLSSRTTIEEDGCARIEMGFHPGESRDSIQKLWLEISWKDEEAPLFHYVANNNMRHNYGGATPRGGRIRWIIPDQSGIHAWPAVPPTWESEPGPDDGVIWHALQTHSNQYRVDEAWIERYRGTSHENARELDNFVPYIWLGSAKRGLAWFGDTDRHYRTSPDQPVQTLSREGNRVVLRIYFLQQPTVIEEPFTITHGLMASPTKPMRTNWRQDPVPGGAGLPVICWGGYWCADKYPDNRDFSIVDLRQEARRREQRGESYWSPQMEEQLAFRARNRAWIDSDTLGYPWEQTIRHWFGHNATYFEEYIIRQRSEEWQVFQDEWAVNSFNRFLDADAHWYVGATPRSYRDFVLFYANEWLKRGVSLYFDNTFPKVDHNHFANGFHGRSFTMWSQRDYHRRIYKLLSHYNERGSEWPLHFTLHMTNTQVLPHTTWATATLDLEQGYRISRDGRELPFPPDYTLAVTLGRQVGVTPHVMYPMRNIGRFTITDRTLTPRQDLNDWGMYVVHEMAHPWYWRETWFDPETLVHDYRHQFLYAFEYGKPGTVVHNYWADQPFLKISHPDVRWIVLTREQEPQGLLVLQSYNPSAVEVVLTLPSGTVLTDVENVEVIHPDEHGRSTLKMPEDYGTRMFVMSQSQMHLPDQPLIPLTSPPASAVP